MTPLTRDLSDDPLMRVAVAFLAAASSLAMSADAFGHDWRHPEYDGWYDSLQRPDLPNGNDGFTSCCGKTDCHTTEAEMRGPDWWARVGVRQQNGDWDLQDWIKIPPDIVLRHQRNPTKEAVICHSSNRVMGGGSLDLSNLTVWCFVPPVQS